jgi:hypothetical protein
MLRVRPLVLTSDVESGGRFLRALGLVAAVDPAPSPSCAVFDAGSGRVALQACVPGGGEEGGTALAFDVAEVREFARRTTEAGTPVELTEDGHGVAARVTAPDGISFLATTGPRETGTPPSPLSVLALWHTTGIGPAARVMTDIGARPRISSEAGTWHDFTARNGGLVALHAGRRTAVELAFEYDGDVREILPPLAAGGFEPVVVDESYGRSLRVAAPWGAEVRIDERQRYLSGCTVH